MREVGIGLEMAPRARGEARHGSWVVGLVGVLCVSVAGCTWVALNPEADGIRVAPDAASVADCQQVGGVRARTKASVGFFSRSTEKVALELETLAKNDAVELGANTILAEAPPSIDGVQHFKAYRCP